jgi:hypothetical protein
MRHLALVIILSLLVGGLAGCGGGKTARATAERFLAAMKNQKFGEAALVWDFETQARKDNDDWDSIVESQRKLIIGKLAEEHAKVLEMWGQHFPMAAKIVEFNETGETAHAVLEGAQISGFKMRLGTDGWLITGFD